MMPSMSPRSALWRGLLAATLVVACSPPTPSATPGASLQANASPSALPSPEASVATPTAGPTTSPTFEPEPTPADPSARRTEIEINPNVVDRPGVPADLRDKYWWQASDVGLLGTTAQLGLPSGETVIDAAGGLVVSWRARADGEQGTELVVRRFDTGSVLGEVHTLQVRVDARIVGRRLFWTGMRAGEGCPAGANVDGGVWAMDLTAGSAPVALVDPGRVVDCGFGGRALRLSPSGRTLAAAMFAEPFWIDVIDVARLVRTHRIRDLVWPRAITDDTFVQWDQQPTDGIGFGLGGLTAYDLDDKAVRWAFPGADEVVQFGPGPTVALGSQFFIEYAWNLTPEQPQSSSEIDRVLATFDPPTGERRELLRQRDTPEENDLATIQGELSSASHLTLRLGDDPIGIDGRSFAILDVATGAVTWDAFTIDPPWLCWSEGCLRD